MVVRQLKIFQQHDLVMWRAPQAPTSKVVTPSAKEALARASHDLTEGAGKGKSSIYECSSQRAIVEAVR